ncbi:MAG: hypothetical protein COU31_04885 [Candidatus Magasanikbacteria bacterium CG10_big_fil_rev_8_21_14_0_10_40_10]|uniref:Uncharacterized protein n=1 Tax=Candidatus Magasanikbacteria bacterium CG10_big_fil_rev_8_21_14_0_10_40_10 TaxID=1974648 RepID=A0A2M6W2Q4_9BACT|nr:MAG: hypothetical protein COU31_04885 [Candidatus Magasanikbacteria bacterium CG10_big_fil_rev_8_21_14_0_10_40_10]
MKEGIGHFIKSILWPVFCVGCGQEGEWWCLKCQRQEDFCLLDNCPACNQPNCQRDCQAFINGSFFIARVGAFFDYDHTNQIGRLIKQLKYGMAFDMAGTLIDVVAKAFANNISALAENFFSSEPVCLMPVPLYPSRQRQRGFNQARLIAEWFCSASSKVGRKIELLPDEFLVRVKYTDPQARLSAKKRRQNLRGAFEWRSGEMAPKNIVLIDDVYTTGATMNECARVLRANGAKSIMGLCLARGEMN